MKLRDNKWRITKVLVFLAGKVWSATGRLLAGIKATFEYMGVKNPIVTKSGIIIGIISTAYVRIFTRGPSLWRHFAPLEEKKKQEAVLWEGSFPKKAVIAVIAAIGVIAFITDGAQGYFGNAELINAADHNKDRQLYWVVFVTGAYAVISSFIVEYSFVIKNGLFNTAFLYDKLAAIKNSEEPLNYKEISKNIIQTGIVGTLGSVAYSTFAYFSVRMLFEDYIPYPVPEEIIQLLAIIAMSATFITNIFSRLAETYKYYHNSNETLGIEKLNGFAKILLFLHMSVGILDIFTYVFAYYSGCVQTFIGLGASPKDLWVAIASIPPALSCGVLHYIFCIRPMIKNLVGFLEPREEIDLEKGKKEEDESSMPLLGKKNDSHANNSCLAQYLSLLGIYKPASIVSSSEDEYFSNHKNLN